MKTSHVVAGIAVGLTSAGMLGCGNGAEKPVDISYKQAVSNVKRAELILQAKDGPEDAIDHFALRNGNYTFNLPADAQVFKPENSKVTSFGRETSSGRADHLYIIHSASEGDMKILLSGTGDKEFAETKEFEKASRLNWIGGTYHLMNLSGKKDEVIFKVEAFGADVPRNFGNLK